MDKIGTLWGLVFGALWGYLSIQFDFELAKVIVDVIDQGFENGLGVRISQEVGPAVVLLVLGGAVGAVVGGLIGTGVRKNT